MSSRRNFLKQTAVLAGAGSCHSVHRLIAKNNSTQHPVRFIFMTKCSGLRPAELALPSFNDDQKRRDQQKNEMVADLTRHELPKWMSILDPHKKDMAIVQGLSAKGIACGHSGNQACLGMFKTSDRRILGEVKWATIDVELGRLYPSPFEHIEVQTVGARRGIVAGQAAIGKMAYNLAYADPKTAYMQLFRNAARANTRTIKEVEADDVVMSYLGHLIKRNYNDLEGLEHLKMTNYGQTVYKIRKRDYELRKIGPKILKNLPKKRLNSQHFSEGASTVLKQEAFAEILISAFKAGLTNSALFTLDTLRTRYTGIPELDKGMSLHLHDLGHGKKVAGIANETLRGYIRSHHMRLIDRMVRAFKQKPEGRGNMFDNTVIMYQAENGESHHSTGVEQPIIMLAGKNAKMNFIGNYVRLPGYGQSGHKTLGNWYTTLLNNNGNPIEHYGQLDAGLYKFGIDQKGPIRDFLV